MEMAAAEVDVLYSFREYQYEKYMLRVWMSSEEARGRDFKHGCCGVVRTFVISLGLPVSFRVVDGPVVIYACWQEIWCAFLRL
jgi:hypothetical protein